jgi:antitoxin HigA-1
MAMPMKNPAHPGEVLKGLWLDHNGLSVADAASLLGVTRQQLHRVVSGRSSVTAEMALRLEQVFGSTADTWLRMQVGYDLAQLRAKGRRIKLKPYRPKGGKSARAAAAPAQ